MESEAKCGQCGASVDTEAKFCPSCGAKIEEKVGELPVTLSLLIEHMGEDFEEMGYGVFKLVLPLSPERSQLIFAFPQEDEEGDELRHSIQLGSPFAAVKGVNVKKVVEASEESEFGFIKAGDTYHLTTSIRPWQLASVEAYAELYVRLAFAADELEQNLMGTDTF